MNSQRIIWSSGTLMNNQKIINSIYELQTFSSHNGLRQGDALWIVVCSTKETHYNNKHKRHTQFNNAYADDRSGTITDGLGPSIVSIVDSSPIGLPFSHLISNHWVALNVNSITFL